MSKGPSGPSEWGARIRFRAGLVLAAVGATSLLMPVGAARADGPGISGGGSSFAALEIDQWRADVARKPYSLKINYVAQGSSFGRQQYASGSLDFGASDIPFQPGDPSLGSRSSFVYVPVSAGGIGFMYNLVDGSGRKVSDLKLTRRAACRIFTEAGMRWDDPEIVAHNPGLAGASREIRPVVRQDGSGTSYVLSEFCQSVASDVWGSFIQRLLTTNPGGLSPEFKGGQPVSNWPVGWGRVSSGLAADGVANAVADPVNGKDAITYNEAGFAKERGLPNAVVQNSAGVFVGPEEEAVTVALGYAVPNTPGGQEDGTFRLNYEGPDPRAYFPSTYSYVIAQTTGFPEDKGQVLARFLCYAVTKGQEVATSLAYARLSSVLVDLSLRQISRIPGFPGLENCAVAGAAAPPPPPDLQGGGGGAGGGGGGGADGQGPGADGASGAGPDALTEAQRAEAEAEAAAAAAAAEAQQRAREEQELNLKKAAAKLRVSASQVFWLMILGAAMCGALVWVTGLTRRGAV